MILKNRNLKEEKGISPRRISKVIQMKCIVIIVKVDEMYNILKSVLATGERKSHINVSSKQV